jgi:membrane-bound serine protease (ClpP class)
LRRLTSVGVLFAALAIVLSAAPAVGQTDDPDDTSPDRLDVDAGVVGIIEVSGLIDPILVDFIETTIRQAEESGDRYLILNINSPGAVAPDADLAGLARTIAESDVPVASWVGPSGSQALGGAAQIVSVTDPIGVAPGSSIGDAGPSILPAELGEPFGENAALLRDDTVGAVRAIELGIAAEEAPTIGQFAITLPGFETQEVTQDGEPSLEPLTVVRFSELDLVSQLFHTVASPPVTYMLLGIGMALIVFELFTAGVGIAGLVGAGSIIMSSYGLWVLPVRWWAVLLVLLSFVAFSIDVQTGVPRVWTGIGFVMFAVGTFWFYDGLSISWVTLAAAFIGIALTYIGGMPAMVRTRFSTPTIGREWMIGEPGLARGAIDPDGVVIIQGAPWRARTNRATPIADGETVRVVSLEGLLLEVEPEGGAAKDYRERSDDH